MEKDWVWRKDTGCYQRPLEFLLADEPPFIVFQLFTPRSVRIHFQLANQGQMTLQAKKHPTGDPFDKQWEPNQNQKFSR